MIKAWKIKHRTELIATNYCTGTICTFECKVPGRGGHDCEAYVELFQGGSPLTRAITNDREVGTTERRPDREGAL